ncbi:DUF2855 family protein [Aspergillus stella-maris]|uniref:DUF2855 family protein n=1 Tax=Aspergillus stella-maris TaxID=1810926 RepID=UPI003CCE4946
MDIHVISKTDNSQHKTISVPAPTHALGASSVRVRATLLSLSSNNLTYALGGTWLNWWDAYPVPLSAPAPYNDQSAWGIVPAWGLAAVTESKIPEIPKGETLYGFWPTSNHEVDLNLTLAEDGVKGHYREVSKARSTLMPLYNRYNVFDTGKKDLKELGWEAAGIKPIFMAGYALSDFVFSFDTKANAPIHPLGNTAPPDASWTAEDANLSKAVFVSLSASGKTARSFAFNLFQRPSGVGPLGLLQVTSQPGVLDDAATKLKPNFPVWNVSYTGLDTGIGWVKALKPERIVIADFGARDGATAKFVELLEGVEELKDLKRLVLAVGYEQKVYTLPDLAASQSSMASLKKQQFNTSPILEVAIQQNGLEKYHTEVKERFDLWLEKRGDAAPDLKLVWGGGVFGESGIEGGWERLCKSEVKPEEALEHSTWEVSVRNGKGWSI